MKSIVEVGQQMTTAEAGALVLLTAALLIAVIGSIERLLSSVAYKRDQEVCRHLARISAEHSRMVNLLAYCERAMRLNNTADEWRELADDYFIDDQAGDLVGQIVDAIRNDCVQVLNEVQVTEEGGHDLDLRFP